MAAIRLLIVDPEILHPGDLYWTRARGTLAASGVEIAIACGAPEEALGRPAQPARFEAADVAVVDVSRRGPGLLTLLEALGDDDAGLPVVALVNAVDDDGLSLAIAAGAAACVGRSQPEQLVRAVYEVGRGISPIQRDLAGRPALVWNLALELRRRLRHTPAQAPPPTAVVEVSGRPLTGRERDVLEMVADGIGYREIGAALGIAERTVKNHMCHVLEKLGAHGRAHAVRIAIEAGWICPDIGGGVAARHEPLGAAA